MNHFKWVSIAYRLLVVLFTALTLISCYEEIKFKSIGEEGVRTNGKDIYIGGTAMNANGIPAATYWKNNVPVNLSATYPDAIIYNSAGFGMTVSGKDIYVCGVLITSKGNYPLYWKNGEPVLLSPGNGEATDIAVVGKNVYVSGVIQYPNGDFYGAIWKNGVISYLTQGPTHSNTRSLVVSGGNVYVGGYLIQDGKTYGTYWKNGNPVLLTSGENFADVHSLAVSGNTVYAAGIELGNEMGKYWKDGQVVNLTDGSVKVIVTAVYTKGNDVYVAGKRIDGTSVELIVWKNNAIISATPTNGFDLSINDIIAIHNEVTVTGSVVYRNDNSSVYSYATQWTNGNPTTLAQGADGTNVYFANSIVTVSDNR